MVDIVIAGGTVVTLNETRDIIDDGGIAVDDGQIVGVGTSEEIEANYDPDRKINAEEQVVIPGLISSHTHVSDILLRGGIATDRDHYDWLFNVKFPGVNVMTTEDHAVASALYTYEALRSGVTTFVENGVGSGDGYPEEVVDKKVEVYGDAGIRNIYGQSFVDKELSEKTAKFVELQQSKEPEVNHAPRSVTDTDEALDSIASLIETYHEGAEGKQCVWPAPVSPRSTSPEGLIGSYELANEYDVMTTTHVAESPHDNDAVGGDRLSMVEFLHDIGYLGERALLGHTVHLSDRDIRLLANSDTRAAHNPLTNLALAAGFAPVPTMLHHGITVGLGTDNTSGSDTVNMINDLRFAAMLHKATTHDAEAMTAEQAIEMATISNARAIGMEDQLGSIESSKIADIVLVDIDKPHLTPSQDPVSTIVYQAQGYEVDTVICGGDVVVDNKEVPGVREKFPNLLEESRRRSEEIIERAGLSHMKDREWTSI